MSIPPLWRDVGEALDIQTNLVKFWFDMRGQDYCKEWSSDGFLGIKDQPHKMHLVLGQIMREAPLYVIESEMCSLAWETSTKRADEPLLQEDLPSPSGLMLLGQSLPGAHETLVEATLAKAIAAVLWATMITPDGRAQVWVFTLDDLHIPFGVRSAQGAAVAEAFSPSRLILGQGFVWPVGASYMDGNDAERRPRLPFAQSLTGLFALMQQRIAVGTTERPPRHAKRRAERIGISSPLVRVVHLRRALREQATASVPAGVDWSHRWVVNGHWRNQWYPSLETHRQRWINPYVKGPETKPLVTKPVVFRVDR